MSNNIQLHKNDLPDDLNLGNIIAVDGEFMGLNVRRDPLMSNSNFLRKNLMPILFNLIETNYNAPNLKKILEDNEKHY